MTEAFAHPHREAVPPVAGDAPRPVWSVMIPAYNCAHHLPETLQGVLDQDQGPLAMQIEVIDDCSSDDVEGVVARIGRGRINFQRHPRRVGHIANFQACLVRARGQLVHLLHGDDVVRPGFYEALRKGFDSSPDIGAAFCRSIYVDGAGQALSEMPEEQPEAGPLADAVEKLASEQRIMTPSIAVRRSVYEQVGGFDRRLACAEDWEMWVRIAARYGIWYEPQALAAYRMHGNSNTGRHARTAGDMAYTRRAIEIFSADLPAGKRAEITARARTAYARASLANAARMLVQGEFRGFRAQLAEAIRFQPPLTSAARLARLLLAGTRRHAS